MTTGRVLGTGKATNSPSNNLENLTDQNLDSTFLRILFTIELKELDIMDHNLLKEDYNHN